KPSTWLSYDASRSCNLLRGSLSNPSLAEDRVPLWPQTVSHRQRLDHLFRWNLQLLSSRRRTYLLEKLSDRFPVGPVEIGAHYRSHSGPPTVQTRLTRHNIQRVAEEMLGTTTWPGATRNTHRNATTDQRLHHCADTFLATLNNLLRV